MNGLKEDRVGPASYNPSYKFIKTKGSTAATKFSSDKIQRNIFPPDKGIPGPGEYHFNYLEFHDKYKPNNLSCFSSLVPKFTTELIKDESEVLRGPGSYGKLSNWIKSNRQVFAKPSDIGKFDLFGKSKKVPGPGYYTISRKISPHEGNFQIHPSIE